MTLRNLRVFVKVAECGKMSTVAKQLYVSQSSVSQSITDIEREYGVVLFDRVGKQLHITPVGRELLEYARKSIAYQDSIEAWLSQCSKLKRLRTGATVTVGSTILSELLTRVRRRGPDIQVTAFVSNTDAVVEKILSSEVDIAILEGKTSNPQISSRVIMEDRLLLVCGQGHRFFGRTSIPISELNGEAFLLREHGSGTRAQLVEKLEKFHIDYREVWESSSSEAIKRGVIDGHGISVISERLVREELAVGTLWACPIEEFPIRRNFSLAVYRNRVETDSMKLFSDIAEELAAEEALL